MSNDTATSTSSSSSSPATILPPALVPPAASHAPAASAAVTAHNDVWPFRLTIVALGSATLLPVAGAIALGIEGKTVPEILVSIASVAAGALAGFLMPTPLSRSADAATSKDSTP